MTTPHDPTMSHSSLDAVIAADMQAVEAGDVPNRQNLFDQHPAIADQLHAFFADFDRMDRIASPPRNAAGLDATSDVNGNGPSVLPTVHISAIANCWRKSPGAAWASSTRLARHRSTG